MKGIDLLRHIGPEFAYLGSYGTYLAPKFAPEFAYLGPDKVLRGCVPLSVTDSSCYRFGRTLLETRIHKLAGDGEGVNHDFREGLKIDMPCSAFCFECARIVSRKGQNGKSPLETPI